MRDLIDFAKSPQVDKFVRGVLGEIREDVFHGVFVGYHPLWERLWYTRLAQGIGSPHPHGFPDFDWGFQSQPPPYEAQPNAQWLPDEWRFYCERSGSPRHNHPPFIIIFRLKPGTSADADLMSKIDSLLRGGPSFATTEERPIPQLYALWKGGSKAIEGGGAILTSKNAYGTLGGFLTDGKKMYGMTCGHVAEAGDDVFSYNTFTKNKGAKIGSCVYATTLQPNAQCGANCYFDPSAQNLDASVIELSAPITKTVRGVGAIQDVVPATKVPRSVEVSGAETPHSYFEVHQFGLWQEIRIPGSQCACFKELFNLRPPAANVGNAKLGLMLNRSIKDGDSGAWVCAANKQGNHDVCGMVISGDGIDGYAIFADSMFDWASSQNNGAQLHPA